MFRSVWKYAVGAACLLYNVQAQSYMSEPIPGNYTGMWRPQVHFSPPRGFMNDPNGMHRDANGTWHLYFQYNPTGIVAGNQHWGHATSQDLYHWVNQPVALAPLNASSFIFSGSAVIDENNTSGFFPNQTNGVVAIYTVATYEPIELQTQFIAYSYDDGYTFEAYEGNPVLDIGSNQFRDPYVIWYEDHWVMVIAYATEFTVGIFTSHDLKEWTHASNFTDYGLIGLQYECPNLVEVPIDGTDEMTWLMQISINPGAPYGGSIAEYFLGDFDGYKFSPRDNITRLSDFGKDAYAGQFFHGLERGQAVSMNWASNWQYTQQVPTGPSEGWRSAMSVPRSISVREVERIGWVEIVRPYDLTPVLGDVLEKRTMGNSSFAVDYSSLESNALHINITVRDLPLPRGDRSGTMNLTFSSPNTGEQLQTVAFFGGDAAVAINRGGTRGFENIYFTDKFSLANLMPTTWTFEAIVDRSVYETFFDDGAAASTTVFYPSSPLTVLTFGAQGLPGNTSIEITVTGFKRSWAEYENEQGTVLGNTTMTSTNGTMSKRYNAYQDYDAGFSIM